MTHEEELEEYQVYVEKLNMDFTLSRYKDLCLPLLDSGYTPLTVYSYLDKWKGRYDYLSLRKPTKRVLDLLDEFDVKATFFVVADVVDHYPGLVESIVERGHEIGCHGLHHACKK